MLVQVEDEETHLATEEEIRTRENHFANDGKQTLAGICRENHNIPNGHSAQLSPAGGVPSLQCDKRCAHPVANSGLRQLMLRQRCLEPTFRSVSDDLQRKDFIHVRLVSVAS